MVLDFLGPKLLADKGNKQVDTAFLDAIPVVCLYFSASWCLPCKNFTPLLATTYSAINQGQRQLEVVFVSVDQNEEEFAEYYKTMPWLAMYFDVDKLSEVSDRFNIGAIPSLAILNRDGSLRSVEGKAQVETFGSAVIEQWKK